MYTLYGVKQSTTMSYNLHGNLTCDMLNHMLHDLLRTLDKEQNPNWHFHMSSLVCAYNTMPHSVTGYQQHELMFGHKVSTVCDAGLVWQNIMTSTGGSHLGCTAVKPDSHLAWIFCHNCFFSLCNLM